MRPMRLAGFLVALTPVLLGCPGEITPDPFVVALDAGWLAMREGRYADAEELFGQAGSIGPDRWEPETGQGWARIRMTRFEDALDAFAESQAKGPGQNDPAGGRLVALAGLDRSAAVRDEGRSLLDRDPTYVFSKIPSYTASDVAWLVARAALDLADYPVTAAMLDLLAPGHGLDPAGAAFGERALALLESLRDAV